MSLDYGCCHPTHAMRTKCACGAVVILRGAFGSSYVRCDCGRAHRKSSAPGGSFAKHTGVKATGAVTTGQRKGGRSGCPGVAHLDDPKQRDDIGESIK